MLANNFLKILKANPLANERIHVLNRIAQREGVAHLGVGAAGHFRELALHEVPLGRSGLFIVQNPARSM